VLAGDGDFAGAREQIALAHEMGVPEEATAWLSEAMLEAEDEAYFGLGRFFKYLNVFLALVGVWGLGLAGLFVAGWGLSKKTLKSIEESDPNDLEGTEHKGLRKLYRRVIGIAGIYYYLSQPVVILIVIVSTLGALVFFLWLGRIPIYLMFGIAIAGIVSIFYIVKSWVTRVKVEDPGRVLRDEEAPRLWKLVREVAETIKTRPVDEIRITHGTEVAVYERGSFRAKLSDNAERVLILGAASLNDFELNAFRAVIAHEYGHFSNRDTAGGDIALRVNIDIQRVAAGMIDSGTATYYNLGFQFLRLFDFLFRRITHGATRLQEVLADRVAAHHYGPDAFRRGLTHVIKKDVEFNKIADVEVGAAMATKRPIANLYDLTVTNDATRLEIEEEVAAYMNRPTTEDDTHPSPKDRFRYLENVRPAGTVHSGGKVWDLFANRDEITKEMNKVIDDLVHSQYAPAEGSILGI
jgi:Zn-dependent protease with chaperone function